MLPNEVLIIDDSDDVKTAELINDLSDAFSRKNISLKYLRGNVGKMSISNARNIGIDASDGEIIFFIDDDVILEKHYIKEILKVYDVNPGAKGVQGFIVNLPFNPLNIYHLLFNSINKVFFLQYYEKNKCNRSRGLSYPYSPNGIIECEYLHGSNMSLKREVLINFRFDNYFTFKGRSLGEDVRLTSKISDYYPHSLFMNPDAKVCHMSFPGKIDKDSIILFTLYFTHILVTPNMYSLKKLVLAFWRILGRFISEAVYFLASKNIYMFLYLAKSYLLAFVHFDEVIKGDFSFCKHELK